MRTVNPIVTPEIIEYVAELVCGGAYKHQIKAKVNEIFGMKVSPRSIERLMQAARKLIKDRADILTTEAFRDSVSWLSGIIGDPDAPLKDRLAAHAQRMEMLGLSAKYRNNDGSPEEKADEIRQFLKEADDASAVS